MENNTINSDTFEADAAEIIAKIDASIADGRTINKIKLNDKQVVIDYTLKPANGDNIDCTLKSYETPLDSFRDAMQYLREYIEPICELPEGYCKDAVVRGVTLVSEGAVMTVLVPLESANAPLVINTPFLPRKAESDAPRLPEECVRQLDRLAVEAYRYLDGERQNVQDSLFDGANDAE